MTDYTHLKALELRLSHEREYLRKAKTEQEKELRSVWVSQIEKEIVDEKKFLGIEETIDADLSDDELLKELGIYN